MSQRVFVRNLGGTPVVVDAMETGDSPSFDTLTLTGGQIVFPATQNASANANTLDDYEEGTWTPVVTFSTPGDLSVSYSAQIGRYTKIGRAVLIECRVVTSTFTHTTANGILQLTGIPFSATDIYIPLGYFNGITMATYTQFGITASGTTWPFVASGSAVVANNLGPTNVPTGAGLQFSFTGTYVV